MKRIAYLIMALCGILSVSCTKEQGAPSIVVDKTEIEAPFTETTTTIAVKCNRDWEATADVEWITMKNSAEEAFEAPSYILVTIQTNDEAERTGTIKIASKKDGLQAVVTVRQGENTEMIRTADRFIEYLKLVADNKATDTYRLVSDIDLAGKTIPTVDEWGVIFDGQGHTISNLTLSAPLAKRIGNKGSVKGLVFDSSCQLMMPSEEGNFGFIASENNGTVESITLNSSATLEEYKGGYKAMIVGLNKGQVNKCVNNGSLSLAAGGVFTTDVIVGGVVGYNTGSGVVADSKNTGAVTVSAAGSSASVLVGGVVAVSEAAVSGCNNDGKVTVLLESAEGKADGQVKGAAIAGVVAYMGHQNGVLSGCGNTGDITLRAGYSAGLATFASTTKLVTNVAGVTAFAVKCAVEKCNNSGKIVSRLSQIDNASAVFQTSARHGAAGIISSTWGNVSDCTNTGDLDIDWITTEHTETAAKQFVCQIGGISGGDYQSDQLSTSIIRCVNEGVVDVTLDASGSNNGIGGIVGWGGKESAASVGKNDINTCENKGAVIVDGFSKSRIGGISGTPVTITKSINRGEVYLKGGLTTCAVGGINGFGNFLPLDGCENYGDVKSDIKLAGTESSAAGGIGGLMGAVGNTVITYSGCKVDCAVIAPDGSAGSMLLGVIGHNKTVSKNQFLIGTEDSPMLIRGSYNGVTVTAENYQTYMRRPGFKLDNPNVLFNVKFWN